MLILVQKADTFTAFEGKKTVNCFQTCSILGQGMTTLFTLHFFDKLEPLSFVSHFSCCTLAELMNCCGLRAFKILKLCF